MSEKVFIVTGELSGDRLAAWYLEKMGLNGSRVLARDDKQGLPVIQAIGGDYLQAAGVPLYARFETLNVTGIIEIIKHLPRLLRSLNDLKNYILNNNFDEVVLVDFPGFNLRLARMLKQQKPGLKITYLSPPQVWCWGAWRIKKLKKYCDQLIVLYPFEVAWYAKRGLAVSWIGNPVHDAMQPFMTAGHSKKNMIALMPGSRVGEIESLLPILLKTAQLIKKQVVDVRFVMPLARSLKETLLKEIAHKHGLDAILKDIHLIHDDIEKYTTLAECIVALSKPGTVTLELALLKVPTVVFYKTSWLTYFLAWLVVKVSWMALPNLIMHKIMFPEVVQYDVMPDNLAQKVMELYISSQNNDALYQQIMYDCAGLDKILSQGNL